jgi:hypothetical protein
MSALGWVGAGEYSEMEYFLPREGTLMVNYVCKSTRAVHGQRHELELGNEEERQQVGLARPRAP